MSALQKLAEWRGNTLAKAAQNEELKAAFEKHRTETEGQIERLEKVFAVIEK
jgi:ferritin-like metal-binding protein YciE